MDRETEPKGQIGSCREHLHQSGVLVDDLAPALLAGQYPNALKLLEVDRGSLALRDAGVDEESDLAVRLAEDEFDELLRVDLRNLSAATLRCPIEEVVGGC